MLGMAIGLCLAGCGGDGAGTAAAVGPPTPSAAERTGDAGDVRAVPVAASDEAAAVDPDYVKFRELFPHAELPHAISPDMDPEVEAIPIDLQMKFLEHGNDLTRPYGRFDLKAGFDCLVAVEDPVEGVHYLVLNVFTANGERKGTLEVAGNDGTEYSGFLRADGKVRVTENPGGVSGLKEAKVRVYGIQEDGSIREVGE
jgi:hypothetical protein